MLWWVIPAHRAHHHHRCRNCAMIGCAPTDCAAPSVPNNGTDPFHICCPSRHPCYSDHRRAERPLYFCFCSKSDSCNCEYDIRDPVSIKKSYFGLFLDAFWYCFFLWREISNEVAHLECKCSVCTSSECAIEMIFYTCEWMWWGASGLTFVSIMQRELLLNLLGEDDLAEKWWLVRNSMI